MDETPERRVWIAQCLCGPARHCIVAATAEAGTPEEARREALEPLKAAVRRMTADGSIDAWCGLCGAAEPGWRYEVGRTRWRTHEEALPTLQEMERRMILTSALLGGRPQGKPN